MDRYGSGLQSKGYNLDLGGRKRVQLPNEPSKGLSSGFSYGQPNMYHSTPKLKPTSVSTTMASSTFKPRTTSSTYYPPTSMASVRASRNKSPLRSTSPIGRRSTSPRRSGSPSRYLATSPLSPSKQPADIDNDTIQRQRRELQLLIGELKDRDRELNDMVQAHQKQIVAWEDDRQRVFSLEKRCSRLESELKTKAEQFKSLQTRLKAAESEEQSKNKELEETQVQLQHVSEQANTSIHQAQDLEDKNNSLTNSMRELSNTIGQLQAREQELSTRLKLKDNDIMEANVRLGEMQQKIRRLEGLCQELKKGESSLKNERDHWKDQALANKNEVEKLRGDINKQFNDADEIQADIAKTKQEVLVLQKELFLAGEREKRKDQLLELQKSKQERTDSELQNIRQICERQQRDISYMQMQLHSSHEMFKADSDAGTVTGYQEDRQPNGNYNPLDDKPSYQPNADYDNQDMMSTKSLDFEGPTGVTPVSNYATIGSDFGDDLESLSQEPLQAPLLNDRPYGSAGGMDPYPNTRAQPYYDGAATKPDPYIPIGGNPYPPIGGMSISGARPEVDMTGMYMPFTSGGMSAVRPMNGYGGYPVGTPQAAGPAEDSSPTSKLHRLLAESRQMVENLEQVSSLPVKASPAKQEPGVGPDQYTPPQRHLGSPHTSNALTGTTN